jgi:DHA1 family bicyclomycin/chloramphenicol resistance-like MFS transporter
MGFIQMSIGAMMSAVVSVLQNGTSLPMTGVMALCSFTASLMLAFSSKILLKKASKQLVEEEEVEMISTL